MMAKAAQLIRSGGIIVYPTETVYGLGANALDEHTILRIFQIKNRPLKMPVFLAVSSLEMLQEVAEVTDKDLDLLKKLFPGPISVLVRKRDIVPDLLTAGSHLVGVRFPEHETAIKIIDKSGPITSTSANETGSIPPISVEEVSQRIRDKVDLIVDGGRSRYAQPSTLLDLSSRSIIRKGAGLDNVLKAIS
ncbi:MAG: threonylcarbamoyl-AMP synthase [Methanotrichaceae archaeon]|nr:threonylcarbamoyl-AMP synthase [Methanotrichaceae archaeon]